MTLPTAYPGGGAPATELPGPGSGRDPNIVALLSLKLLLLGFFILLNALSQYEEDRTRRVLISVNEAFDGRVEVRDSEKTYPSALGPLEREAALIDAVGRLLDDLLPAVRTASTHDGTRLRLEISAGSIFRPGRTGLQPGRALLMRRLAGALTAERRGELSYRFEILHGLPDGAADPGSAEPAALAIRRGGVLARDLVARGVPAEKLSVGLLPGHPGRLRLVLWLPETPVRLLDLDYGELAP
jgi:hypothetical protein